MASLSLPRVLQLKKNSLDAEREQFEKFQTLAIQKAINAIETPVKEKHVRSALIGTFQEQSAITYWMVAIRLPLQENRIVAWKFCHVTHKLLREGHPACLDDSQRHISMIENLGKLWVHLREGYGKLVHLYCNLLVCKLKFHARNPRFPGNMQLTADELDAIAENDVNNYFQICVELFDYMDDILNLQAAVFDSLGNARANSMTASGQCRLAALIPCAQDSSHIYDCNVRLLFRLHAALPADTLAGHRDRFRQQFRKLSSFYKHASSLQYYRNLLTLPILPSNPPNFLLQSDFGTYVAPVVSIPEPPPDEVDTVASLIDTSDTISLATTPDENTFPSRATPSPLPDPVLERDRLIDHLQHELKRMRSEVSQLVQERNSMLGSMREHCARLESQVQAAKTELEEERQKAEVLSAQAPEIKQKLSETEEKAKITDEKFQKLKGAYTQLREEHINLIRQKAEVDKSTASLRAAAAQHESAKMALQQQLNDRMKDVELLQQSASSSEEIEAYKSELSSLRNELELSRQKELELQTLKASFEALEIEHRTATTEQQEKLTTTANELKEVTEALEKMKRDNKEQESELTRVKEELRGAREKSGDEYKRAVEEKELALKQVAELTQKHELEKEELVRSIKDLQADLEILNQSSHTQSKNVAQIEKLSNEYSNKISELNKAFEDKDNELKEAIDNLKIMQNELECAKLEKENIFKEQTLEIHNLKEKIHDLTKNMENSSLIIKELDAAKNEAEMHFKDVQTEKETILSEYETKIAQLSEGHNQSKHYYEESLSSKSNEILELKKQLQEVIDTKEKQFDTLQKLVQEKTDMCNSQIVENEKFMKTISALEADIGGKDIEIRNLNKQLDDLNSSIEKQKYTFEDKQKDNQREISVLEDKLKNIIASKEEIIANLKNMLSEKDEQVIKLHVEVNKFSREATRLEEELMESQAELEIGQNELLALRDEHEAIIDKNERNLLLKNKELRDLNQKIEELSKDKDNLLAEKANLLKQFDTEKQVLKSDIEELEQKKEKLKNELQEKINSLKLEYDNLLISKQNDIQLLNNKIEIHSKTNIAALEEKDSTISNLKIELEKLRKEAEEAKFSTENGLSEIKIALKESEKEYKILEVRLDHIEREKLNAECELQDLLQHNTVLEADLINAKRRMEEMQVELERERSKVLSFAGAAALEMTSSALDALERGAREHGQALTDLAAGALHQIATRAEVKGNEESLGRLALVAAHNTAQLSAYVSEVANCTTDVEIHDKLYSESRSMLESSKQCMEQLSAGAAPGDTAAQCAALVRAAGGAAGRAATAAPARSVDDELADMDAAIQHAAAQIEEMAAASRLGDTGVKLEVNGTILEWCTALMCAVRELVRAARRLQLELGDPVARERVYRRNPQWTNGLISAAKAVVFAAKLLVTSADEAVCGGGCVEGVCAAAQEVSASTAQLVAASRARAPPTAPALAATATASRAVAAAVAQLLAAVKRASSLLQEQDTLDTSTLTLTATRRLEMESKVRSLELETALEAERVRLAALRKRHYQLAQQEENGNMTNGKK